MIYSVEIIDIYQIRHKCRALWKQYLRDPVVHRSKSQDIPVICLLKKIAYPLIIFPIQTAKSKLHKYTPSHIQKMPDTYIPMKCPAPIILPLYLLYPHRSSKNFFLFFSSGMEHQPFKAAFGRADATCQIFFENLTHSTLPSAAHSAQKTAFRAGQNQAAYTFQSGCPSAEPDFPDSLYMNPCSSSGHGGSLFGKFHSR